MDQKKIDELVENLQTHELNEEQRTAIDAVRKLGTEFAKAIGSLLPDSRHAALWATHFEDAQDRAVRAIVVGNYPTRQIKVASLTEKCCTSPCRSYPEVSESSNDTVNSNAGDCCGGSACQDMPAAST